MGLAPLMLFTTVLLVVRNQRILAAWNARQEQTQRRAAAGLPPENPQTTPQAPRRAHRRAALTRNRHDQEPRARHHQPGQPPQPGKSTPDTRTNHRTSPGTGPKTPARDQGLPEGPNVRPKRENRPH